MSCEGAAECDEMKALSRSRSHAGSKRGRQEEEEEEESRPESSHTRPTTKKLRLKPVLALQVRGEEQAVLIINLESCFSVACSHM